MLNIAVLVSGGGTNLQAIIDAIEQKKIRDVRISLVISNKKEARALERAKNHGIEGMSILPGDYADKEEYGRAMAEEIDKRDVGLIVLAGFLVVLPPGFVKHYDLRIINIHPSLIPSFCGDGCYGLRVHERVLERGVKITGATVHYVDSGTDTGPIIMQKPVEVKNGDIPEVLQKRVMEEAEWIILPAVIDLIAHGKVEVKNKIAYVTK